MSSFFEVGTEILKVFTIYGHGCHLGHVTWIIYPLSIDSPYVSLRNLALIGHSVSEKKYGNINFHPYCPGVEADPWGLGTIGQGHLRIMIYINFVEVHSLLLHAMPSFKTIGLLKKKIC